MVGITWGVDEMNKSKRPIKDRVLKEMQLEGVLAGVSVWARILSTSSFYIPDKNFLKARTYFW